MQVDFYVLAEASDSARVKFACRVIERAYREGLTVLARVDDATQLRLLDDTLWTFGDGSFVPHELVTPGGAAAEAPVQLVAGSIPAHVAPATFGLLVNLGTDAPGELAGFNRIAEVIDAEPARRTAGRARFRRYREAGAEPRTHNIEANSST